MQSTVEITEGNYKGKIKNNLKSHDRFMWKVTFKDLKYFSNYRASDFYITDCYHMRLDCQVEIDPEQAMVRVIPTYNYDKNKYYYLTIKYTLRKDPLYVAFRITDAHFETISFANKAEYADFMKEDRLSTKESFQTKNNSNEKSLEDTFVVPPREYLGPLPFKFNLFFMWLNILVVLIEIILEMTMMDTGVTNATMPLVIFLVPLTTILQLFVYLKQKKSPAYQAITTYNNGVTAFNASDYPLARDYFQEALTFNPHNLAIEKGLELCQKYTTSMSLLDKETVYFEKAHFNYNHTFIIVSGILNFLQILIVHILELQWRFSQYIYDFFIITFILQLIVLIIQYTSKKQKSIATYNAGISSLLAKDFTLSKELLLKSHSLDGNNLHTIKALEYLT